MRIIIVGCGKVGSALAEQLSAEGHELTLIDLSERRLEKLTNRLDLTAVAGSGTSYQVLLEAGVQDTAEEVRALRQQGVRVAAVFMGENASAPDARTIYGQDLVRIQRMDQLAAAAVKLIQEEIRELSE